MYDTKVLALIPARGGSKGIPRKNIKELCGKPLIAWTIETALQSSLIDRVVVSTENEEIAEVSRKWGAEVPFMRPMELAKDDSHRNEVVRHVLFELSDYKYLILLQPTSPLRTTKQIEESIELFFLKNANTCVSVVEQHPSPHWIFKKTVDNKLISVIENANFGRRQDLPKYYALNGAIYIIKSDFFTKSVVNDPFITNETVMYKMDKITSIDIDDEFDFKIAELFMKNYK